MSKVLVTGGAGYIGSHSVLALIEAGHEVVAYDNLSTGLAEAVLPPARLVVGDLADEARLEQVLAREGFDAVVHFAASIIVPESVENPLKYYDNNSVNTCGLIRLCAKHKVKSFIFSSTAAVYGMPADPLVTERTPADPINPYGRSKLFSEWVLQDASRAHPELQHVILRYFNVAGADPRERLGQNNPAATHLIKVACQAALGIRDQVSIFGSDYPTADGTGVRDFIHVSDLADIHVRALDYVERERRSEVLNCGYGRGYSVRQIIEAVRQASGGNFPVVEGPRRPGDPAELVADASRMRELLGFTPRYDDIQAIVSSSLRWEERLRRKAA